MEKGKKMAEYIERKALIHVICKSDSAIPFADVKRVIAAIAAAPTADVVEVVRCKDCKHFKHNLENDTYCSARDGLSDPEEYTFCSYGERKEDA